MKALTIRQPWAGAIAHQAEPKRKVWSIKGHKRVLTPLGQVTPRQPTAEGWRSACGCGWAAPQSHPSKRAAEVAYRSHLDEVPSEQWPACKRCEQHTRPSAMSTGSPHLCKKCRTAATREWAERNPSAWERHLRKSLLKRRYGITIEEADALLEQQHGRCAICGVAEGDSRGFRLHIDHNHATGVVRGILCHLCNSGLGHFRDNPEFLTKAIAYLAASEERKTA